jgi:hypothetical protein
MSNNKRTNNNHAAPPSPERAVDAARSVVAASEATLAELEGQRARCWQGRPS